IRDCAIAAGPKIISTKSRPSAYSSRRYPDPRPHGRVISQHTAKRGCELHIFKQGSARFRRSVVIDTDLRTAATPTRGNLQTDFDTSSAYQHRCRVFWGKRRI